MDEQGKATEDDNEHSLRMKLWGASVASALVKFLKLF